ncbi:CNNM domain-containing protein, partial [Mycobacterium ulcerans]
VYGLLVSDMMQPFWNWVMPGQQNNPYIRLLVEATLSTTVIVLLGEFIPKSFFKAKGEPLLVFLAPLISLFYKMLYPIAAVFVSVAEWVLKYLF